MFGREKFGEFTLFEHKNFGGLYRLLKRLLDDFRLANRQTFPLPNFPTILYYFNIPVLSGYNSITLIYL